MKGLALDSGEFIPADELNARWLPRKATEEEMSKLTDEQIDRLLPEIVNGGFTVITYGRAVARAIEAAATEPLLQRIAELEKALKLVKQHHATAWNRGHIAGMAANRKVAQDALNAVKKDAWNNTQLTEALMAAEGRCEELERQLEEARKDAERYRWLVAQMMHPDADHQEEMFNRLHAINPDPANAKEVDAAIDAAMQKGQS